MSEWPLGALIVFWFSAGVILGVLYGWWARGLGKDRE